MKNLALFIAFFGGFYALVPARNWCPEHAHCNCTRGQHESCLVSKCAPRGNETADQLLLQHLPASTCQLYLINFADVNFQQNFTLNFTELSKIKYVNVIGLDWVGKVVDSLSRSERAQITHLELPDNSIKELAEGGFAHFDSLTMLDLSSNMIEELKADHFRNLSTLNYLYLSGNRLKVLEKDVFIFTPNLDTLQLNNNNISSIDKDSFKGLDMLTTLALNYNKLKTVEANTLRLPQLETLELGNNQLQVLSEHLVEAPRLRQFYIQANQLSIIEEGAAKRRRQIDNFLRVNSDTIQVLYFSVCFSYVERNQLSYLPRSFYDQLDYDTYDSVIGQFYGNPWNCDCEQIPFVLWLQQRRLVEIGNATSVPLDDHTRYGSRMTCGSPPALRDVSLLNLNLAQLTCEGATASPVDCHARPAHAQCQHVRHDTCTAAHDRCYVCPSGFFNDRPDQALCHKCLPLTDSGFGSHSCSCISGFEKNGSECVGCPYHSFKFGLSDEGCIPCDLSTSVGTKYLASDRCDCLPGYSNNQSTGICEILSFVENSTVISNLMLPNVTDSSGFYKSNYDTTVIVIAGSGSLVILGIAFGLTHRFYKRKKKKKAKDPKLRMTQLLQTVNFPQSLDNNYISHEKYSHYMVEPHNIRLEGVLGQGAFGVVHRALVTGLHRQPEESTAAVKSLKDDHSSEERDALHSELQQLFYVGHHPNIVNLLGFTCVDDTLMLIFEFAERGDLLSFLKNKVMDIQYASLRFDADSAPADQPPHNPDRIEAKTLLAIVWQVAKGMHHLAQMKCIHRDLAARNVLLTRDLVAKVSDFGLARAVYESGYYFKETKGRLPLKWMSPESILEGQYTTRSDVWSFGVLLWEVFTLGGNPYPGVPINSLLELLLSGYRMAKPPNCHDNVFELMTECWRERPKDRPSFETLYEQLDLILQQTARSDYIDFRLSDDSVNYVNEQPKPDTGQFSNGEILSNTLINID